MEISIIMSYREQITPWIVVRLLPQMQRRILARFKNRSDADSYAQTLRRLEPVQILILFDSGEPENPEQNRSTHQDT